ncbi:hypothetical protein ZONE111905_16225 [Zobellia nedashkovskayae]
MIKNLSPAFIVIAGLYFFKQSVCGFKNDFYIWTNEQK